MSTGQRSASVRRVLRTLGGCALFACAGCSFTFDRVYFEGTTSAGDGATVSDETIRVAEGGIVSFVALPEDRDGNVEREVKEADFGLELVAGAEFARLLKAPVPHQWAVVGVAAGEGQIEVRFRRQPVKRIPVIVEP